MKLLPFILLLGLGVTACTRPSDSAKSPDSTQASDTTNSADSTPPANPDDKVTMVDKDDPDMLAAFAKARSETDNFIAIMIAGTGDSYSVKVAVTDNGQTEYFWLDGLTYANGVFSGTIDNDPELVKNVKMGQPINVKKEDIYDWLYMKDGKMYGNYTVRVLLPKMSKEDADKIRAMLPPNDAP
jgi:uncharacterized protein YegJ (DUF2314 family)